MEKKRQDDFIQSVWKTMRAIEIRATSERPVKLQQLAAEHAQEVLGSGINSFVVPFGDEYVLAIPYLPENYTDEQERRLFQLHTIGSILFPHNIPMFYPSTEMLSNGKPIPGMVRKRIDGSPYLATYEVPEDAVSQFWRKIESKLHGVRFPLYKAVQEMNALGLPMTFDLGNTGNVFLTRNGEEFYMDELELTLLPRRRIDLLALEKFMHEKKIKGEGRESVLKAVHYLASEYGVEKV